MRRLLAVAVFAVLAVNSDAKNPIVKFLQMHNMNMERGISKKGRDDEICVPPETKQSLEAKLAVFEGVRSEAVAELEAIKAEHEIYRKEAEMRLDQFAQASVSANKIAKVQEEYASKVSKLHVHADAELTAVKAVLTTKESELKALTADYESATKALRQTIDERLSETESEWKRRIADVDNDSKATVSKMQADLGAQIKQLLEEKSVLLGEKKALLAQLANLETKYEAMLKDHDAALQIYLQEELAAAVRKNSGDGLQRLNKELEENRESSEASIQQLTAELDNIKRSSAVTLNKWNDEYATLKSSTTATIAKLTHDYETLKTLGDAKAAETNDASDKALNELRHSSAAELAETIRQLTASHDKVVADLNDKLELMTDAQRRTLEKLNEIGTEHSAFKEKYEEKLEVARYWESQYEKRSYINVTHISTDAFAYAAEAQKNATEAMARVAAPVVLKSRELYDGHIAPSIELSKEVYEQYVVPSAVKSRELFDVHVQPHVTKAAEAAHPYYHQYVAVHIDALTAVVTQAVANLTDAARAAFDEMVAQFGAACPSAMASLRSMEQTTRIPVPPIVMENAKYSCRYPEESVVALMKGMAVILVILLRRLIWRLVWGTIRLVVALIWFFHPIRYLFYRKRPVVATSPSYGATNGDNGAKAGAPFSNGKGKR